MCTCTTSSIYQHGRVRQGCQLERQSSNLPKNAKMIKERYFEHVLQHAYCTQSKNGRQGSGNVDEY